ncbi:hypothetical protein BDP27DRAFT_1214970 [Rhodocollybia butyracea]|uniref:Uncharacterized protein n=1 Tax=Rhodocollybia butyracea TaxID=206335 RepID=A0A9P5UCA5_9AGAR|nr:hypothetical protein BDP27DRAFT_1214970 [Rhodocollybia butyracea]
MRLFRWRWHQGRDLEWAFTVILASISTPGSPRNLKEFTFHNSSHRATPFPLPPLHTLQTLSIEGKFVPKNLLPIISSAPHLETLQLLRLGAPTWLDVPLTPQICNIGLNGWAVQVPRLIHSNLQSLELGELIEYNNPHIVDNPFSFREDAFNSLWDTLSLEQIHLRSLVVSFRTTDSLLRYITSYSGLETLSLRGNWQPGTGDSFYKYALPKHADTLVKLEIMPDYEGEWCFREKNAEVFRRCRRLQTLLIVVSSRGLDQDPEASNISEMDNDLDAIEILINPVVCAFPMYILQWDWVHLAMKTS